MKKALVVGMGVSGQAVAALLLAEGKEVIAVDKNREKPDADAQVNALKAKGVQFCEEALFSDFEAVDRVIFSSGIRKGHPLLSRARADGIEIIGEADFALQKLKQPCIAITGTNGKTTVTLLVEHLLKESGRKAKAVGNVGSALCSYCLLPQKEEILVVELSSYQLETLSSRYFDVGVVLNISADHLDVYPSLEEYARAKCLLKNYLKPEAPFYIHADAQRTFGDLLEGGAPKTFEYGEAIANFLPMQYRQLAVHESENAFAAWLLVREFGVTREEFLSGLKTFKKPAHRIEFVDVIDGVSYYDDSKGTNVDAVIRAVEAMKGPVLLIVGGVDKGASYAPWESISFRQKIKAIFAIGQAAPRISAELSKLFKVERMPSLEEAVRCAKESAAEGDNVLLSPACASFDMFRDYGHRGEVFKNCVRKFKDAHFG
jgi:UDP-N-acetylmuramoylalanine--D-glutamate ligase